MSAARSVDETILVVVSPAALALDGESVRVARDVLGAAFAMKAVVPGSLAELQRALSRRGQKRLVVIGDDRALHQVVQVLHRQSGLGSGALAIIPVGKGHKVALARALGAATLPVEAARAVVRGAERSLDLLVDESGGVVLGGLRIPGRGPAAKTADAGTESQAGTGATAAARNTAANPADEHATAAIRSLRANSPTAGRSIVHPDSRAEWCARLAGVARSARAAVGQLLPAARSEGGQLLRVEADGRLLADLDHPVRLVSAWNAWSSASTGTAAAPLGRSADRAAAPDDGLMEILVSSSAAAGGAVRVQAHRITISGGPPDGFTYEADDALRGPVHQRTWTVEPGAWRLTVPPAA